MVLPWPVKSTILQPIWDMVLCSLPVYLYLDAEVYVHVLTSTRIYLFLYMCIHTCVYAYIAKICTLRVLYGLFASCLCVTALAFVHSTSYIYIYVNIYLYIYIYMYYTHCYLDLYPFHRPIFGPQGPGEGCLCRLTCMHAMICFSQSLLIGYHYLYCP